MLSNLFLMTRIHLLNFSDMWILPVIAFVVLAAFRLFWGKKQPVKSLLIVMPIALVIVALWNGYAATSETGFLPIFGRIEVMLLFGWVGLLLSHLLCLLKKRA